MNNTLLIVTVYKNRYTKLIEYLHNTELDNIDVLLLAQTNDTYKEYEKYEKKNMSVLYADVTSIQQKRKYGYHYAIDKGYKYLIWNDDDINPYAMYIDFKHKTKGGYNHTMSTPLENAYYRLLELVKDHPDGGVYTLYRPGFLGMSVKREYVNKGAHPSQFVLLNLKTLKEHDIDYNDNANYMEDQCFYLDALISGLPMYVAGNFSFTTYSSYNWEKNTSLVYSNEEGGRKKRDLQQIRQWKKYGGVLSLGKKGNLTTYLKYKKFFNAKELPVHYSAIDKDLEEITKGEVTEKMLDEVYEYLQALKTK